MSTAGRLSEGGGSEIEDLITRLVFEYAENTPASRPIDPSLSLRSDLAIESLSLVSMTLRIGEELGVDVVELGLELRNLQTFGDLLNLGRSIEDSKVKTRTA